MITDFVSLLLKSTLLRYNLYTINCTNLRFWHLHTPMKPSPQSRVNTSITGCLLRLLVIPPSTPLPQSRQPRTCLLSLQISLHFIEYCINGIRQYVCFFGLASYMQHNYAAIHSHQYFILFIADCYSHCTDMPKFVYPFSYWQTLWFFSKKFVIYYK